MSFSLTFSIAYLACLYFCDLDLVLKPIEAIKPFPDLSNFPFDSEDVIFNFSRLSNFDEMSNVTYLSLPLISLCFFQGDVLVITPDLIVFSNISTTTIFHVHS